MLVKCWAIVESLPRANLNSAIGLTVPLRLGQHRSFNVGPVFDIRWATVVAPSMLVMLAGGWANLKVVDGPTLVLPPSPSPHTNAGEQSWANLKVAIGPTLV